MIKSSVEASGSLVIISNAITPVTYQNLKKTVWIKEQCLLSLAMGLGLLITDYAFVLINKLMRLKKTIGKRACSTIRLHDRGCFLEAKEPGYRREVDRSIGIEPFGWCCWKSKAATPPCSRMIASWAFFP